MPMPSRNRHAVRAANNPPALPPAPYDPADRAAKTMSIMVDAMSAHFRE